MHYPKTPTFKLYKKRALITGAGRGIGLGASLALAQAGSEIVMVSRTEEELKKINSYLNAEGYSSSYKVLDVTELQETKKFIKDQNPFDILVNNAGTNIPSSLIDSQIKDVEYVISLNLKSVINLTKHVVKKMVKKKIPGSIINVSSIMGHVGSPNRSTYCSTKFAVEGFTKALSLELAREKIRVNSICPTYIKTPMTKPFLKNKEFKKYVLSMIPVGRLGEIQDIMGPIVFLASDASSLMTGTSLLIDGGWTAR